MDEEYDYLGRKRDRAQRPRPSFPDLEPFMEDYLAWVMDDDEHLVGTAKLLACSQAIIDLQEASWLMSDLRVQILNELWRPKDGSEGISKNRLAQILGISGPSLDRIFRKGLEPRKRGGLTNNEVSRQRAWNKSRRERRANGEKI